ncbi:unnamed protein product [Symbiodinium natans]|uniref:Uncharacterized protein n=1 Tax=Symbiodinium natans TaxID=878477 RepID=A0A812GA10_9DINO|nr:unnamed protein product [Symbiodinium natans]
MLAAELGQRPSRAVRLLHAVQRLGLAEPNVLSITMAMSCLDGMIDGTDIEPPSRMAGWEAASRMLDDSHKTALELNTVTYTALIGLQERAGRWESAQAVIKHSRLARLVYDAPAYHAAMRVLLDTGRGRDMLARAPPPCSENLGAAS